MYSHMFCYLLTLVLIILSTAGIPSVQIEDNVNIQDLQDSKKEQNFHTLEELVKTNREAYVIWNISNKYNTLKPDDINESCVSELQENSKLIPFYVVNLTLEESEMLISSRIQWLHTGEEMSYAHLYENSTKIISDQEIYAATIENMIVDYLNEGNENICVSNSFCGCISKRILNYYISRFPNYKEQTQRLWIFILFRSYLEPFSRILLIIIGMLLNSALLFIFIREKSIRTESNILIVNLVISNIIMLLIYIPSDYIKKYVVFQEANKFIAIEVLTVSANALTILFLNIQRYFQVSRVLSTGDQSCVSAPISRCIIYLAVLWVWSTILALFFGNIDYGSALIFEVLLNLLMYTVVYSIVLSVFNSLTARKLHRAAKDGRTSTEFQHIIGSGVVLGLTILYYSTHIPFYIYRIFEITLLGFISDMFTPITFRIIIFLLHLTFYSYPFISMVVLYKTNGTYRNFFNKYFFRCWYNPGESKYVTMSSISNNEPGE